MTQDGGNISLQDAANPVANLSLGANSLLFFFLYTLLYMYKLSTTQPDMPFISSVHI